MNIRSYPNDSLILGAILLLSGFGIVMMYSASSIYAMNEYDDYLYFFLRQTRWLIIGTVLMFVFSQMNYRHLKELAYVLIFFSWIFLIYQMLNDTDFIWVRNLIVVMILCD